MSITEKQWKLFEKLLGDYQENEFDVLKKELSSDIKSFREYISFELNTDDEESN